MPKYIDFKTLKTQHLDTVVHKIIVKDVDKVVLKAVRLVHLRTKCD